MSLFVADGTLVTQDRERRVVRGNIFAEKGRIVEVDGPERSADVRLDAADCLVIPGLVNGYTRSAHVLLGPPRDLSWAAMQDAMAGLGANLTKRDLEVAAALATSEMLASGTTCLLDFFTWEEEVGRAVAQAGMRGVLAWTIAAPEDLAPARRYIGRTRGRDRIVPMVGAAALSDPDLVAEVAGLAREEGTRWCLPVAERRSDVYRFQRAVGKRPVAWLEEEGLLSSELLVVHGVWLTLNEIRALARGRVPVIHCPASNQMTGAGGPGPLPEMLDEGVVVGLGTDTPFLGGTLNLRDTLRFCGLVHRGNRWDPTIVSAQALLDLGTLGGARALGLEGGGLQAGDAADLVVLERRGVATPVDTPEEILSLLVYGGRALRVRDVVVDGRLVMEGGVVQGFDLPELRARVLDVRRELGLANPRD